VRGTTSILNSALKHGSTVKRFVLTSSAAAIRENSPHPRVYTEEDWNDAAVEAVKTKGSAAGPIVIYLASKTLAEKAAWEFVNLHKSEISWDFVVLNPPYIFGARLFFLLHFSSESDAFMGIYSRRSALRRRSMISIHPNVKSMTLSLEHGQVRNCRDREIGSM
jgi:nucleoside-diphosphate-sugar epimerase